MPCTQSAWSLNDQIPVSLVAHHSFPRRLKNFRALLAGVFPLWLSGCLNLDLTSPEPSLPCASSYTAPGEWQTFDFGYFELLAPPEFREIPVQGIDSYVGKLATPDSTRVIGFDWGAYSDPLDRRFYEKNYGYQECYETIGGYPAKSVAFRLTDASWSELYYDDFFAASSWRSVGGGAHLTVSTISGSPQQQRTMLRVLGSVRFK
jgi:hypothetical protein